MGAQVKSLLISLVVLLNMFQAEAIAQQRWVVGYVGNWHNSQNNISEILAQNTFTHLVQFAIGCRDDGVTLFEDPNAHDLTVQSLYMVPLCHAAGTKVLICIFHHYVDVRAAMSPANRNQYVHSIMNVIRTYGYDGVDYDYEDGFDPTLETTYGQTMAVLRDSMNALTTVTGRVYTISLFTFGESYNAWRLAAQSADRVSIATYEMSGAFGGWPVCHGYNLYNGGLRFPNPPVPVPSGDSLWVKWVRSGTPSSKLMIASSTGVSTWNGGRMTRNLLGLPAAGEGARHAGDWWEDAGGIGPNVGVGDNTTWQDIIGQYSAYPTLHDTIAVAAYKTVDNPGYANDKFISFDDPWMWWKKYDYMRRIRNGGGIMMWLVLNGRSGLNNWPLLEAIKIARDGGQLPAAATGTFTVTPDTLPLGGGNVTLTWASQNANVTTISPAVGVVQPNGSMTMNISSTMTFTFSASNMTGGVAIPRRVGVASSGGGTGYVVTDNFNRANSNTLGSGWASPAGRNGLGIVNNQCNGANGTGFSYRTETFTNNQYATINPKAVISGSRFVAVGVRMGGANGQGYYMKTDGRDSRIIKISATGTETTLQTLTGVGFTEYGNDVMSLQVVGNILKGFKNGIQVSLDQTDNDIAGGHPGASTNPDNGCSFDNFEGGGLLVGGQGHQDITIQALPPIALITQPTGGGSTNIEIIRDGFTPPVGSSDRTLQYDTYNGGGARTFDWIGYQFSTQHTFSSVVFQEGMQFSDGGWFTSLGVQVRVGGQWVDVQSLQSTPSYAGANGINYETYELSFAPILGDGIRIAGVPGGSAHYISVAELRVFNNGTSGVTPDPTLPRDYVLLQNYPNPFNPTTKIAFNLPVGIDVTIKVYNVLGQEIATLANGIYDAGRHSIDFSGDRLPNGIYFYAIKAGSFSEMKKMVLLK
jgi:hypothetical protein